MGVDNLEKLKAWKESKELAVWLYKNIIPVLPAEEKWGIAVQLRRAVQSIPTNIAEGFGRYYYQDMVRFCYIARGSLMETISLVELSSDIGYITPDIKTIFSTRSTTVLQLINGYINYLKKSKQGEKENHSISENVTILYSSEVDDIDEIPAIDHSQLSFLDSYDSD